MTQCYRPLPMITEDAARFRHLLRPSARIAGLDLGGKTIGLALATLSVGIASPIGTIRRTRFQDDAKALLDLVSREHIEGLVLGLPLNMDGSAGGRVQSTKAFARNLQTFGPPPILLFDERLSSAAAAEALKAAGAARAFREASIDAFAAQVILQDAIDRLRSINEPDPTNA
jgi:putative holliday junction resolvase